MTTMQLTLTTAEMVLVCVLICLFLISRLRLPSHPVVVSFSISGRPYELLFAWPSSIRRPDWRYSTDQWENTGWGNQSDA